MGGNNKRRKEKESEGTQGDVRGMGQGVAESSSTPVGNKVQELVPSKQEPLEDLLKKVSDSYNPKRKRSSGARIPGTAKENKKRKVASSIPVETPPIRGRATRSLKKQSEAKLEKALEKSKRKATAKGKKKVVEPDEAVKIDDMDPVRQDEEEVEEMEVVTQKAKKIKASTKKSLSKTKSAGPSSLVKRTRSVLKSRKVKIMEEEEWSGEKEEEEESDAEKDNMGWKEMVLQMDGKLARTEIVEFMVNCEIKDGKVTSVVKGVTVSFDDKELGEILGVPHCRAGKEAYCHNERQINWPGFIIQLLDRVLTGTKTHVIPYVHTTPKEHGSSKKVHVNSKVRALVQESGAKNFEIERLKKMLEEVEAERDALRAELAKEKEKNDGILQDMLKLLQAKNQEPGPSQP
ncbi:uncharacterized protein [Nicotiana tomentosiformis]|uniref:uncharacterized protein n=1 Tax=Nicotiana tomentosiformis TaxID=4098 RepID=UPI00388C940C